MAIHPKSCHTHGSRTKKRTALPRPEQAKRISIPHCKIGKNQRGLPRGSLRHDFQNPITRSEKIEAPKPVRREGGGVYNKVIAGIVRPTASAYYNAFMYARRAGERGAREQHAGREVRAARDARPGWESRIRYARSMHAAL